MKITKVELKRIIKEEIGRVLREQSLGKIDFEGTETSIEFLGMGTKYDQTEVKLRINGDEYSILGAYDIDSLADEVISNIEDDDEYYYFGLIRQMHIRDNIFTHDVFFMCKEDESDTPEDEEAGLVSFNKDGSSQLEFDWKVG